MWFFNFFLQKNSVLNPYIFATFGVKNLNSSNYQMTTTQVSKIIIKFAVPLMDVYLGVQTLVPPELLTLWDEYELELLLCGIRQYNLDQLKDNHAIVGVQTFRFTFTDFFFEYLVFS